VRKEKFFDSLEDARAHVKLLEDAGMTLNLSGKLQEGQYVDRFEYETSGPRAGNVRGVTVYWHDRSGR
jgi:hypothetical protein